MESQSEVIRCCKSQSETEDDISAKQSVSTDVTSTKLNTFDDTRTNRKDSDDITAKQENVGDMSNCQQAVKSSGEHVNTSKDKPNQETTDKCESTGEHELDVKECLDGGVEKQDGCIKSSIHEENSQSLSCRVEKEDDSAMQNSIDKSSICNQDFSRLMSPHKAVADISRHRDEHPVEKNETQNRHSVLEKSKSSMVVAPCRPQSDILDDSSTAAGSRSDEGSSECKNERKASERINWEKNGSDPAKGADQRSGDMAVNGSSDENVTVSEHKSESPQESTFSPIQPFTSVSPIESGNSKRPLCDDEASDGEVATSVSPTAKKKKTDREVREEHSGAHSLGVSHRFKVTCSFDEDSISDFSSPLVDFNALESDHEGDGGKSDSSEKRIKAGKNGSQNGVTESDTNQNCISDVSQKQPKAMCREPDVSIDRVVPTDVCNMSSDSTDGNDNSTKIKPANQISLDSNQPRCTKLSPNHNKKDCDKGENLLQKLTSKESTAERDMAEEKEKRESKDNHGSNHSEDVAAGIDVDDGDGSSDEENDDGIGDDGGFYDESDEDDNNYDADNHSDGADDIFTSSYAVASDTDDSEDEDDDDFDRRPPKLMNNFFRDSNFDDGDDSEDEDDEEKQPPLLINELCKDITTDDSDDSIGELSDPFSKVKVNGHRSKSSKTSEEPPMLPIATKRKPTSSPTVSGKRQKICTEENSDISSAESSPKKTEQPSYSKVSEVAGKVAKALGQAKDSEVVQRFRKHALLKEESDKKAPGSLLPTSRTKRRLLPNASNVTLQNIDRHLSNCNNVLKELEVTLNGCDNLNCVTTVNKWKDELKELQQKKTLPKTVIAVVGDTGAGKSSLMNALLDEEAVLPTSGMRACTAVVVEIINNESSSRYEAEIEFLSKKEWDDELKLLLNDLIDADGKVKSRPDPKSDAGIAYCKVRDVYGKIASYTELQGLRNVTRKLGTVEKISCLRPREFRRQIDRYIDSNDDDAKGSRSGGKFWPIVKRVKVKIPNCDVCSSGAVLVDLPGVRDSNAARDNIAKQYLKTCTAVWVVADITRAVDNKTAKDLLGESFRRQLLMDGQYGSVAFICTKNDLINPSEIIRALHLGEQCEAIESEIDKIRVTMQPLQEEKELLDDRKEDVEAEIESVRDDVNDLKKEILDLRKIVEPVDLNLEEEDDESEECSEERRQLEELKEELQEKRHYIKEKQNTLEEIAKLTADKIKEMLPFEKAIEKKQMKLRELCAKARNEFAKTQIKRDFKAGLKEMKKKAGLLPEDADIEDDEEEDEFVYDSDDDDDEIVRTADKLKVFTVSSTEYLKLKDKLTRDGPPQVFSSIEDTQIPAIKRFVHDITCTRRLQGTERLIRSIGRYQEDLLSYLTDEGTESKRARTSAKFTFDSHLGMLQKNLKPILNTLESDIDEAFDGCISPKLRDGVNAAKESCIAIQMKWGSKVNKENRSVGGLHWATYKATVKRNGAYNSATAGPIDFNQDLSEPMYSSIMIQWDKVFSGVLMRTLDSCIHSILGTLKRFFLNLQRELQALGIALDRITRVSQQQLDSAAIKLKSAVGELKVWIQDSQRDINRLIPPSIQSYMEPVYNTCTNESGSGSFARMKGHMERHVVVESSVMFDAASTTMLEQLMVLQQEIVARFRAACETICENIALHYQPFWDLPTKTKALRESMLPGILRSSEMVKALYKDAKIVELKENLLDNKPAGSATVSSDSKPTGDCKPGGQVTPVQQQTITVPGSSGSGVSSEPRRQEVIHSKPPDTAQQYHAHNSNQVPKGFSQYGAVLNSFNVKPSGVSVPGSGPSSTVHRAPLNSILSIQNHIKTQGVQYKSGIKLEHAQVSGTQITGPTSSTKTQGKPANYSQPYHIPCMPGQQSVRKPSPSKYTAFQLPGSNTGRIAAIEMPMKPSSIQQVPLHPLAGKLIRLESPASPAVLQQLRNQGCVILPPQQAVQVKTPSVQNLTPSQNTAGTAASRVTTGLYAMPHKPVTVKREPAIHTGTSSAARTSRTTTSTTTTSSNRNTNNYSSIKVKQEPGCIPSTSTGKKKYRSKIVDYVDLTQDSSDDDTYQPPLKKKKDKDDMKRYKKYH
ncbi:myosin-2 heavy chain-like isoform X2 [Ptychodera flava]|uniref:myosin-2 heavy chain-like isoform X2 n=1 Tax=Ptychodera flava TaxID=63121 RepID=UPI00396AAB0D